MLSWIASMADPLLAGVSALFALLMAPTIFNQWRVQASTIPLTSSIPTVLAFLLVMLVYSSLGLWITVSVEAVQTMMWVIVVGQRVRYT